MFGANEVLVRVIIVLLYSGWHRYEGVRSYGVDIVEREDIAKGLQFLILLSVHLNLLHRSCESLDGIPHEISSSCDQCIEREDIAKWSPTPDPVAFVFIF